MAQPRLNLLSVVLSFDQSTVKFGHKKRKTPGSTGKGEVNDLNNLRDYTEESGEGNSETELKLINETQKKMHEKITTILLK